MTESIKTIFTKDEIDEFIKDLQGSIGDEKRVKELLGIKSLPILVAYLKEIGMPEKIVSKAAAVEMTRVRMIDLFTNPKVRNCVISDKGIEYDFNYNKEYYRREKLGLDENNIFRLSKDRYFQIIEDYYERVFLMNCLENAYEPRIEISDAGYTRMIDHYMGVIGLKTSRKQINGVPYFEIKRKLMDGSIEYQKMIDTGLPFFSGNQDSTYEENYNMYTTLFPEMKKWYDKYFWVGEFYPDDWWKQDKRTIKEKSDDIDRALILERLYKIDLDIFGLKSNIMNEIKKYRKNKSEIAEILVKLQEHKCDDKAESEKVDELIIRAEELLTKETEIDDKNRIEEIKSELSVKDDVRKYGNLDLEVLHQELDERYNKKERLSKIENPLLAINEEYQKIFEEAQRVLENRSEENVQIKDDDVLDVRTRLAEMKKILIPKIQNFSEIIESIYTLLMELGDLRAVNIVDEWCDKVDDLKEKHGIKYESDNDIDKLYNRLECLNTDENQLSDDSELNEEDTEYELMLCEKLLKRIEYATFDFEDWKKELERIKGIFIEVRADEIAEKEKRKNNADGKKYREDENKSILDTERDVEM